MLPQPGPSRAQHLYKHSRGGQGQHLVWDTIFALFLSFFKA